MMSDKFNLIAKRAFELSEEGIAIVDISLAGQPLVYVNSGFMRLTGYDASEILGKNCRFLQNNVKQNAKNRLIRETIEKHGSCSTDIVNFRKNGEKFTNLIRLSPIVEKDKPIRYYLGIQTTLGTPETIVEQFIELAKKPTIH